ncbi:MAG: type II toxin-antitoxin system MqsA family antitoxin [Oscillospiraceae bacterium]
MTCFICNGNMEESVTNHFVTLDNGSMIIIKNVPCMRCVQCGETWYNGVVAENLEEIIESLEKSLTEVAIVNYHGKVA